MSTKPASIGGWGYIGSFLASQVPPAALNALQIMFLDNGTGVPPYGSYQFSDGQAWQALGVGGGGSWGSITGTLASQTDLNTALGLKANAAAPAHSGTGTGTLAMPATWTMVSTPAPADNSLKVATTAYADLKANIASPAHSGTGTGTLAMPATWTMVSTPTQADNSLKVATTAYADTLGATKAPGGTTVALVATTLTINAANAATYNGNVVACTNAATQTITIASGLPAGFSCVFEQLGAGLVVLTPSATTLNAPNGLSTSGPRTTSALLFEATDVFTVLVAPTADRTFVNAAAGATPAVNLSLYNIVDLTLTANCTPAFSGSVSGQFFSVTLILRQDATGGRTLTLPTTKWAGGVAPTYVTTANAINIITLSTIDGGSTYFGFLGGTGFA